MEGEWYYSYMNSPTYRAFGIATLLSAILVFAGSLLAPVEVRFVEAITASTAISGLIFGGASITLVFLSHYVAQLSNRYGRRNTILYGLLFGFIYALLYASVVNTLGLLGVKFAWAFAIAATNPILAAYVQHLLVGNKNQGRYFGYYYAVQSIAGSAGALLGGYLFTLAGFYLVAYALAGAYAVAFLITLFLPNNESNSKVEGDVKLQTQTYSIFALLKVLLTKPSLRFYLASNIATAPNWGVKPFLWPLVIFAISGSDVITGSIFATMGLVAFMLLPFAGMVADKVGPYRVIVVELFLFSVTGITMALTGTIAVFWVAAAVYTIAEVFNLAQAMILTEELDENIRSQAMALDTAFDQIIGFISPLLAGVLVTLYSPSVALLFFMSLYVFGFVATLSLFRKHQFGVRC